MHHMSLLMNYILLHELFMEESVANMLCYVSLYFKPSYFNSALILETFASMDLAYIHFSNFSENNEALACTQIFLFKQKIPGVKKKWPSTKKAC